jgi:hypothetical protein
MCKKAFSRKYSLKSQLWTHHNLEFKFQVIDLPKIFKVENKNECGSPKMNYSTMTNKSPFLSSSSSDGSAISRALINKYNNLKIPNNEYGNSSYASQDLQIDSSCYPREIVHLQNPLLLPENLLVNNIENTLTDHSVLE